jgi:hypothetical protein
VVIDHNNEETVNEVLERGYWAAFSIYPGTKMGNERMVEIVRQYGAERIIVDSACDWGISEPLGRAQDRELMRERGIPRSGQEGVLRQRARRLRPERPDERGRLARRAGASTRLISTRAIRSCAAAATRASNPPRRPSAGGRRS